MMIPVTARRRKRLSARDRNTGIHPELGVRSRKRIISRNRNTSTSRLLGLGSRKKPTSRDLGPSIPRFLGPRSRGTARLRDLNTSFAHALGPRSRRPSLAHASAASARDVAPKSDKPAPVHMPSRSCTGTGMAVKGRNPTDAHMHRHCARRRPHIRRGPAPVSGSRPSPCRNGGIR